MKLTDDIKITPEEAEKKRIELELHILKQQLDRYVKLLVKYDFPDAATGSVYFKQAYDDLLKIGFERIHKNNIEHSEFDIPGFTEKPSIDNSLKWNKMLVDFAKFDLNMLPNDVKEKMVRDSLEMKAIWTTQFNRNSRLDALIAEKNNKKYKKKNTGVSKTKVRFTSKKKTKKKVKKNGNGTN